MIIVLCTNMENEAQERINKFKEACLKASQEFDCDFLPAPFLVPVQGGGFKVDAAIQIVDKKGLPMRSPFMDDYGKPL